MPERIQHKRIIIDAKSKPLGRLASRIAYVLQGKDIPAYRPERREGRSVTVLNADHVVLTGKKRTADVRRHHSGFPGGLKTIPVKTIIAKDSRALVRMAVHGMLPNNRLRAKLLLRLTVLKGAN